MSNVEFNKQEFRCPACKWQDGKFDDQLHFSELWSNQYGWGVTVECWECGRVHMVTTLYSPLRFQVVDCGRTVPTKSIIPF